MLSSRRNIQLFAIYIVFLAIIGYGTSTQLHGEEVFTISLHSRTFKPTPGLEKALVVLLRKSDLHRTHMMIQFDNIPTVAERKSLTEKGVKLLACISNLAYFASMPSDESAAREILRIRPTRWLGSILPEDKIDPLLTTKGYGEWATNPDGSVKVKVTFFEDVDRKDARSLIAQLMGKIESEFTTRPSFYISIDPNQIRTLTEHDEVQFVGFYPPPPQTNNDLSTARTGADDVQAFGITGAGVIVSLWDGGEVDDRHYDLAERVIFGETTGSTSDHATHVACTLAGNGTANPNLSGYATGVPTIVSYNFKGNVPNEYAQALTDYSIQVANNSWGRKIGWEKDDGTTWNFYNNQKFYGNYSSTFNAQDYDDFVRDDGLTIVWSAGNSRDQPRSCCATPRLNPVNSVSSGQQRNPAVTMDAFGNFMVVWEDDQDNNDFFEILARGFDAAG
ncbi:MAG: S8 family serine peptidase, partial [Planctomycetes bacterium]|nr:S8 family serine peptidase [Planctomycetota bacterium]